MAWVKVPPENPPIFLAALPRDKRIQTVRLFGGMGAKVGGHFFAGVFGRSVMIWLPEDQRAEALALEGATPFDPMGDGRARSDKVMLPEAFMEEPAELGHWLERSFKAAVALPPKAAKKVAKTVAKKLTTTKKKPAKKTPAKKSAH